VALQSSTLRTVIAPSSTAKGMDMSNTPYLYRPIAMYGGKVLKCCGMASDVSRAIVSDKSIGKGLVPDSTLLTNGVVVETCEYRGDRITKDASGNYVTFNGI
jgi:hypothetical protein